MGEWKENELILKSSLNDSSYSSCKYLLLYCNKIAESMDLFELFDHDLQDEKYGTHSVHTSIDQNIKLSKQELISDFIKVFVRIPPSDSFVFMKRFQIER